MPFFSIIMPVYNRGKLVDRSIQSLRAQIFRDIEIICVDDGSKDNSLEVLYEFARKDDRIKVIHQENGGVAKARNTGMQYATGKYIMFLDSDDEYMPDTCSTVYGRIIEDDSDIVMFEYIKDAIKKTNYHFLSFENEVFQYRRDFTENLMIVTLPTTYGERFVSDGKNFDLYETEGVIWNLAIKKSVIDNLHLRFFTKLNGPDDTLFLFQILLHKGLKFSMIFKPLLQNHDTPNSVSKNVKNIVNCLFIIFKFLQFYAKKHNLSKDGVEYLKYHCQRAIYYFLASQNFGKRYNKYMLNKIGIGDIKIDKAQVAVCCANDLTDSFNKRNKIEIKECSGVKFSRNQSWLRTQYGEGVELLGFLKNAEIKLKIEDDGFVTCIFNTFGNNSYFSKIKVNGEDVLRHTLCVSKDFNFLYKIKVKKGQQLDIQVKTEPFNLIALLRNKYEIYYCKHHVKWRNDTPPTIPPSSEK